MKNSKTLIVIFAILLISQKSYSQKWDVFGNIITSTEYMGANPTSTTPLELKTYPALDINFYTNYSTVTTPRATITSGGDVGIGTTTPSNKLTVSGYADITGRLGIGTTTPANPLSVVGNADVTGKVGIGTAVGASQLVVFGDIDITSAVGYYQLAGTKLDV